jgi:hypothetical protein
VKNLVQLGRHEKNTLYICCTARGGVNANVEAKPPQPQVSNFNSPNTPQLCRAVIRQEFLSMMGPHHVDIGRRHHFLSGRVRFPENLGFTVFSK